MGRESYGIAEVVYDAALDSDIVLCEDGCDVVAAAKKERSACKLGLGASGKVLAGVGGRGAGILTQGGNGRVRFICVGRLHFGRDWGFVG